MTADEAPTTRPFSELAAEVKATWDKPTWELYDAACALFRDKATE